MLEYKRKRGIFMRIVGIICEYNPFHNGHLYHLKKIKELFPDSLIVLALGGYFLERGEVSCLSKYDKTELALSFGVDIVVEIPVVYGSQSADIFAEKAILILQHLHVTDLVFGSESNDATHLLEMAQEQLQDDYQKKVQSFLKEGCNYPTALSKALSSSIQEPNDLLGISYAKAILRQKLPIQIHTIKRTNAYHDVQSNQNIVSASNIREKLKNGADISAYVPYDFSKYFKRVDEQLLWQLVKYRILTDPNLAQYLTVDEGIEFRLKKYAKVAHDMNEFIQLTKTKRYTYNRLHRMIIHILLGLTKEVNQSITLDYLHILGFNLKGQAYLNSIRKKSTLVWKPIVSSPIYQFEIIAAYLYDILTHSSEEQREQSHKPIVKP